MAPTKWGIASAGQISNDFANGITTLDPNEHQIVAVAARSLARAQKLADDFGIKKVYGDYESLANDPDVDVVYIGSINPAHLSMCNIMTAKGKAVLCEKPLAMNVKQTKEILAAAKKNNVFLMEGMWSTFLPSYVKLREELKMGTIGKVFQSNVLFGLILDRDRSQKKEFGGGTMLDTGIYPVYFSTMVMGGERPLEIKVVGHLNEDGVDESISAVMKYSGGRTASFSTHFNVEMPCKAEVYGSKGTLTLPFPFWCTDTLVTPKETIKTPYMKVKNAESYWNSAGFGFEAQHVRECLLQGLKESPIYPHSESIMIAEILEEIRKQVGVVYPQD